MTYDPRADLRTAVSYKGRLVNAERGGNERFGQWSALKAETGREMRRM